MRSLVVLLALVVSPVRADYTYVTLPSPESGASAQAMAINNAGHVLMQVGFNGYLLEAGVYVPVHGYPGFNYYHGLNNADQVVGYAFNPHGTMGGFLSQAGQLTPLPIFAEGINDRGQIVGGGSVLTNGVLTSLLGEPHAINNKGQIVGTNGFFSYVLNGTEYTPLPVSNAYGINNNGDIVGNSGLSGFVKIGDKYTEIRVPGSFNTVAMGINDEGQIVGYYQNDGQSPQGFIATLAPVPEPETVLLLTVAGIACYVRFRR